MARVAVVGVGAIGAVLAGGLTLAGGHELTLCTRRKLDGLQVETPTGEVRVAAKNVTVIADAEPVDWVLVATKTYDAAGAAAWFERLCGPTTRVAVVQNGVEHRERFAPYVAAERIVPVVIDTPAERRPDGSVLQRTAIVMRVANDAEGEAFVKLFPSGDVELVDDFVTAAWNKLCVNATGAISALTIKPVGVLHDEQCGKLAVELVNECVAVGRAVGAKLADGLGEQILTVDRARPVKSVNSMLADRMAGRQTEIDARNGVIVRMGEQHGIATPLNRMAVALMNAI